MVRDTALDLPGSGSQRRETFRIAPAPHAGSFVRFPDTASGVAGRKFKVQDISIGGCALQWPTDLPPPAPNTVLRGVTLQLDVNTRLTVQLRAQGTWPAGSAEPTLRLGCEFVDLTSAQERSVFAFVVQAERFWSKLQRR